MRNVIIFLVLCLTFSCDKKENTSGYNCINGECTATFDSPTYLTLSDCKSVCGTPGTSPTQSKVGSVSISLSWTLTTYLGNITSGSGIIGLGYSLTDVSNDAFILLSIE